MDIAAALPSTAHGIAGETEMAEWQGPVACVNLRPGRESGRQGCHDDLLMTRALIFAALPSRRVTPIGRIGGYIAGL